MALTVDCTATRHTSEQLVTDTPSRRVWVQTTTIECTAGRHDTLAALKIHGCCCPPASRLGNTYEKRRRCGAVAPSCDATGARRRLQALAVDGWTAPTLAAQLGLHDVTVSQIRRGAVPTVFGATANKIAALYAQLAGQSGPSDRTRGYAARHHWHPYTAWDDTTIDDPTADPATDLRCLIGVENVDEVLVERFVAGFPCQQLNKAERYAAYTVMRERGVSCAEIARRLKLSGQTQTAYRTRHERETGNVDRQSVALRRQDQARVDSEQVTA